MKNIFANKFTDQLYMVREHFLPDIEKFHNKNQKSIVEDGENKRRKDKPMYEQEVLSNSAMVMANVEDEIEIDGAEDTNRYVNAISGNQIMPVESIIKGGSDTTDSKEKDEIKEEAPLVSQSASENSRYHNLRPKRSLRHVHALKQQAKRRKRNTCIAATATGSGTSNSQTISNAPDSSTISIQRTVARKPSIGKDNGGK